MTLAIVLVIAAAISLIVILQLARSGALQVREDAALAGKIQPIDVEAFRNLTNPAEDEYLRCRLPGAEFRRVRRERLKAMAAYVRVVKGNARLLVQIGQAAVTSADSNTQQAAHQLVDQALLLQRNAGFALVKIQISMAWPNSGLTASAVLQRYEQLSGSAMLLSRLQNPAAPVRILAT